jgi:hypothetical protein
LHKFISPTFTWARLILYSRQRGVSKYHLQTLETVVGPKRSLAAHLRLLSLPRIVALLLCVRPKRNSFTQKITLESTLETASFIASSFKSPFWRLKFGGGTKIFGKFVDHYGDDDDDNDGDNDDDNNNNNNVKDI